MKSEEEFFCWTKTLREEERSSLFRGQKCERCRVCVSLHRAAYVLPDEKRKETGPSPHGVYSPTLGIGVYLAGSWRQGEVKAGEAHGRFTFWKDRCGCYEHFRVWESFRRLLPQSEGDGGFMGVWGYCMSERKAWRVTPELV